MHHTSKIKVKPFMQMADLIDANPNLLLMLQHFNIDFRVSDQTVMQLCENQGISELPIFTTASGQKDTSPSPVRICFR